MDNVNAYTMKEDGSYAVKDLSGHPPFNVHKEFFNVTKEIIEEVKLF
jgi:polyphosphate kinase